MVHPFWSKKNLKRWMIHAAMLFAWISGALLNMPVIFTTSIIQDGMCLSSFVWPSKAARMIYGAMGIAVFFVLPLVVFIYCYGHIAGPSPLRHCGPGDRKDVQPVKMSPGS